MLKWLAEINDHIDGFFKKKTHKGGNHPAPTPTVTEWDVRDPKHRKEIMSNPKFAELLKSHGVIPPTKISLTTGKETLAFAKSDEEFKKLLEHENETVQALVSARLGVKSTIEETRTERLDRKSVV